MNVNIDYTVTLGQVVQVISTVGVVGAFAVKGGRLIERVVMTITELSKTVAKLSEQVEALAEKLHGVDRRVAIIEGRTQRIIEEE
jgi:methyl-accepting chemotaxis protein